MCNLPTQRGSIGRSLAIFALLFACNGIAAIPASAADEAGELLPQQQLELMRSLDPSLVRVEYLLQFDKGEAPYGSGFGVRCPSCGQYHSESIDTLIPEERPARMAGFLVGPDLVITSDFLLHPRFLRRISVHVGDQSVPATLKAAYMGQNAILLQLEKPLPNTRPLEFDPRGAGPYQGIVRVNSNATWLTSVKPLGLSLTTLASGYRFFAAPSQCLIIPSTPGAKPVALSMNEELDPDGKWKVSPLDWEKIDSDQMSQHLTTLEKQTDNGILHVRLSLRSPRPPGAGGPNMRFSTRTAGPDDQATERHALAVLASPTTLLILDQLRPAVTARLERITVFLPDGRTTDARFAGSFKDHGAIVATLDSPLEGALTLSGDELFVHRNRLMVEAEIKLQGETRMMYTGRRRIAGFRLGWREQIFPVYPSTGRSRFVFDMAGKLVSLPLSRRDKATTEQITRAPTIEDTGARYIQAMLANPQPHYDPANVPLNVEQENRLAWLGVELQGLTPDLARANNVSPLTRDGQTGALVTYVYPDSPASEAGIAPGAVLLRLHVPNQPRPVDIRGADRYAFPDQPFPWDRFDELPEQYFEQIPRPWPTAETEFARALTDIGFDNSFDLEFAVDGKSQRKRLQVRQSPPHFDTAARSKSDALGITVREMTYEVRRYFQRNSGDPGVIISRIEPGSRASKAGLKPYEFITDVNDQSVNTTADFERLIKPGGEAQLSVRRNTRGRVVKITLDGAAPAAPTPTVQN